MLVFLLLLAAFICFVVEFVRSGFRSALAAGLAFWVLVAVIGAWPR